MIRHPKVSPSTKIVKNRMIFNFRKKIPIIGLTRIRNEQLIIKDTLESLSKIVDGIIVYDDDSNDNTVQICQNHPAVLEIIKNHVWKSDCREQEETSNRRALLNASKKYRPDWIVYLDADERLEGDIRKFMLSPESKNVNGIKIRLFDAYITPDDKKPYKSGKLFNLRKHFGPEYRDILMIWRNKPHVKFVGLDMREPIIKGNIITKFYCQHYGKSISIKHWQDTCNYYVNYFPKYAAKWKKRLGKAIHTKSDFDSMLYSWKKVKIKGINLNKI